MDLFIYFPPGMSVPRDEIEDALQECWGERGEVTGGGAGVEGSNLDLLLFDEGESLIDEIRFALIEMEVPAETIMVIDGEENSLGSE